MKRRSSSTIPFGYKLMEDGVHLEEIEDVELLRALEIGLKIKTFSLKGNSFSIDTPKNLKEFRKKIKLDRYYKKYVK